MSNRNPLEEEFRSSQVYKALTSADRTVADKIARGLGKAANEIGDALNGVSPPVKRSVTKAQNFQQKYGPPQNTPRQTAAQQNGGRQNGYSYGQTVQTGPATDKRPNNVTPVPAPQMPPMRMIRTPSPVKYYLAAVAALLYATNAPLYEPAHYIAFALTVGLVFFASGALFKGKKEWVPVDQPKPKKEKKKKKEEPQPQPEPKKEEKPSRTGDPEVDKIIDEGNGYLKRLRAANDAIPEEALSEDIDRMERASADIFRYIADHPEKAPQIRKFMNYYLPTTLKLLNSYQRLSKQSAKGENITSTMFNIAGMMHTVADAFEKQLDSLFTDEAMDISADISVFETLLKQEGFVEEKAERKDTRR